MHLTMVEQVYGVHVQEHSHFTPLFFEHYHPTGNMYIQAHLLIDPLLFLPVRRGWTDSQAMLGANQTARPI